MSVLSNFINNLKLPNWLQAVGVIIAYGGLILHNYKLGIPLSFVGLSIAVIGRLYDFVYKE